MGKALDSKLEAVDEMLERAMPLLNEISQSAYWVREGQLDYSKHRDVEQELTAWVSRNTGLLPNNVVSTVSRLNSRIVEWAMEGGRTATPENFANDDSNSFSEVMRTLQEYKVELLREADVARAVDDASHNPWVSGSFYLTAAVIVLVILALIANAVPIVVLPIILIAAPIMLTVIGALQLRNDDRLQDKSFIELMRLALGALPLLKDASTWLSK